jgi:hypothetical protein
VAIPQLSQDFDGAQTRSIEITRFNMSGRRRVTQAIWRGGDE